MIKNRFPAGLKQSLAELINENVNDSRLLARTPQLFESFLLLFNNSTVEWQRQNEVVVPIPAMRLFPFCACKVMQPDFVLQHVHVEKSAGTFFANRLHASNMYSTYSASLVEDMSARPLKALLYMLNFLADIADGKIPLFTGHYSLAEYYQYSSEMCHGDKSIIATIRPVHEIPLSMYAWMCSSQDLRKSSFFFNYLLPGYGCDPASMSFEEWLLAPMTVDRLKVYERALGLNYDERYTDFPHGGSLDINLVRFLIENIKSISASHLDSLISHHSIPLIWKLSPEQENKSVYSEDFRDKKDHYKKLSTSFAENSLAKEIVLHSLLLDRSTEVGSIRIL